MKYTLIGVIFDSSGKNRIGFRMYNHEAKSTTDTTESSMISVLKSKAAEVINIEYTENGLVGTNGSLDRYPKLISTSNKIVPKYGEPVPFIVLSQIGQVGYEICDFKGVVKKIANNKIIEIAEELGIANGKIVEKDNAKYISSINGSYEITKVARSKTGAGSGLTIAVPMSVGGRPGTSAVEGHVGVDISNILAEEDALKAMTPLQRNILKTYYVWYTVRVYKSIANSIRLDVSTTKAEALAELRGEKEWLFAGVWDAGFHGASKCQLGHAIRYEYYAMPKGVNETLDNLYNKLDRNAVLGLMAIKKKEGEINEDAMAHTIVFGEHCAADFFKISPKDMANLIKTRKIMSEELSMISEIIANDQFQSYMDGLKLFAGLMVKTGSKAGILKAVGEVEGSFLLNFLANNIPVPKSLLRLCTDNIKKDIPSFLKVVYPEYASGIDLIYSESTPVKENGKEQKLEGYYPYGHRATQEYETFFKAAATLLEFVGTTSIEGVYAYDPYDDKNGNRDIGRHNQTTRGNRAALYTVMKRGLDNVLRVGKNIPIEQLQYVLEVANNAAIGMQKIRAIVSHNSKFKTSTENSILIELLTKRSAEAYAINNENATEKLERLKTLDIITDCFGVLYKHTEVNEQPDRNKSSDRNLIGGSIYWARQGLIALKYKPLCGSIGIGLRNLRRDSSWAKEISALSSSQMVHEKIFEDMVKTIVDDFANAVELKEVEVEVEKQPVDGVKLPFPDASLVTEMVKPLVDAGIITRVEEKTEELAKSIKPPNPAFVKLINDYNELFEQAQSKGMLKNIGDALKRAIDISNDIAAKFEKGKSYDGGYYITSKQEWRVKDTIKKLQEMVTETVQEKKENTIVTEEASKKTPQGQESSAGSNFKAIQDYDGLRAAIDDLMADQKGQYGDLAKNIAKAINRSGKASPKQANLIITEHSRNK
jgi:hypothetical protein